MHRAFQSIEEFLDSLIARSQSSAKWIGSDYEPLLLFRLAHGGEAEAKKVIDSAFEGFAGALGLVLDQAGDIVIEGEGGTHIMMLGWEAS